MREKQTRKAKSDATSSSQIASDLAASRTAGGNPAATWACQGAVWGCLKRRLTVVWLWQRASRATPLPGPLTWAKEQEEAHEGGQGEAEGQGDKLQPQYAQICLYFVLQSFRIFV